MVRIAHKDLSSACRDDDPCVSFKAGWAIAVLEVAQEVVRAFDDLAGFVRSEVLAAELQAFYDDDHGPGRPHGTEIRGARSRRSVPRGVELGATRGDQGSVRAKNRCAGPTPLRKRSPAPVEALAGLHRHNGGRHVADHTFPAKADAQAWLSRIETSIQSASWMDPSAGRLTVIEAGKPVVSREPDKKVEHAQA